MSLLRLQAAFRDEIAAPDDGGEPTSLGMEIYRNAYRGRLLAALETSFERTRRWTGEAAFTAAARHHVLTSPPRGWTLDDYGAEFPELIASLFGQDPEVAELARLEWRMQRAFAARDAPTLDPATLGRAGYGPNDWDRLGFVMAAGFSTHPVATDCVALWAALAETDPAEILVQPVAESRLLVWRRGLSPAFRIAPEQEARALDLLALGAPLGDLAALADANTLGAWLARWLGEGLFASAAPLEPA